MLYRVILPEWLRGTSSIPNAIDGEFTEDQLADFNCQGYNIYFYPNHPSHYEPGTTIKGEMIDRFDWVFVDMDLKDGIYPSKEAFLALVSDSPLKPTRIVYSGNGVHAYWRVQDLEPMSYMRLQRRLMRFYKTDEAVCKIHQLMRAPGFANTKQQDEYKLCEVVQDSDTAYTCEQLDKWLPKIAPSDEEYCKRHYDQTYNKNTGDISVDDKLPFKFTRLINSDRDISDLFTKLHDDRSKADFTLAHRLLAEGFTREEAISVLVNCRKALERSPQNRVNYALNIVNKIWVEDQLPFEMMSSSVRDIIRKTGGEQGERFKCWEVFDGTKHGFRLTEVLGLIGGSGSGKTTLALNYFYHFARLNPNYIHLFVSLEQPEQEIAVRWTRIAAENDALHDKVHVLGNYNLDGSYRNLSLSDIETYVIQLEKALKVKVGCLVIDHIGALKKQNKNGENQSLIDICSQMKAVAKHTNTFLVMQSQTSREKAGIGDLELDKDAAYGTTLFEWFCDYIVTTWQPLKRMYAQAPHMTCSAFKYCKIRHKNVRYDKSREDTVHVLMYEPDTERLSIQTQKDEEDYEFFNRQATTLRNKDRKREPTRVSKIDW